MQIDKQNGSICFNEKEHTYWDENDNEKYISVTTLIKRYEQPYDRDFWSAYKALEKLLSPEDWQIEKKTLLNTHKFDNSILDLYDISQNTFNKIQQDILDEWDKTTRESCERGTKIHAQLEKSMYDMGANVSLKKFGIGGKFVCDKGRVSLDLESGVYPEYLIARTSPDGILRIAGQIDLLVKNKNEITICDWKTNKEIKTKGGFDTRSKQTAKMLYPLNNLDDCNLNHYNLQLSIYAWMVQKMNPDFVIKDLILVHFDHNLKQTIYKLPYLKDEVERVLRDYKRQLIHERQQKKYERIEY